MQLIVWYVSRFIKIGNKGRVRVIFSSRCQWSSFAFTVVTNRNCCACSEESGENMIYERREVLK